MVGVALPSFEEILALRANVANITRPESVSLPVTTSNTPVSSSSPAPNATASHISSTAGMATLNATVSGPASASTPESGASSHFGSVPFGGVAALWTLAVIVGSLLA